MIIEETFYAIKCDNCNILADDGDAHKFWKDKEISEDNAIDSDWHKTDDGKHYCPDCHSFNDEDELVITKF